MVKTAAEGADALFYLTPRERIPRAIKKDSQGDQKIFARQRLGMRGRHVV
jgi:hypothetical protein